MSNLRVLARRATGTALGLVLFAALYEPVFGQVKTNVPDVVVGARPARMERITIHGKALEGNLEGNAVDRTVLVILPPSYAAERNRRYPVVYALHGYSIGAEQWSQEIHVPQTVEGAFAKGAREMIVVLPDSKTVHNGSMYSSSVTTGDFENFVARDVVSYIDAHYRTMPNRSSRGLVGHSMGGYGASRIGMKHADVFGSLYIMSPCCLAPRGSGSRQPGERGSPGGRQDAGGLREAALRFACPARVGRGVVSQSEQPAPLSRSADRIEPAGGAGQVGGQLAAGLCRSVCPGPAAVPRDRHRRRRHGQPESRCQ